MGEEKREGARFYVATKPDGNRVVLPSNTNLGQIRREWSVQQVIVQKGNYTAENLLAALQDPDKKEDFNVEDIAHSPQQRRRSQEMDSSPSSPKPQTLTIKEPIQIPTKSNSGGSFSITQAFKDALKAILPSRSQRNVEQQEDKAEKTSTPRRGGP